MQKFSSLRRLMLAGTIAWTGSLSFTAVTLAQDEPEFEPDLFESSLTGWEVEIDGDAFVIEDAGHQEYDDGENEQVQISGALDEETPVLAGIWFVDDSDTPEETIEIWLSGMSEVFEDFEVVDDDSDGDVTWYYAEGVFEDEDIVVYVQVTEDVDGNVDLLESVLTVDGALADAVEVASEDITIDGNGFMEDVDLGDLEDLSGGGSGSNDNSSDDEEDDSSSNDDEDSNSDSNDDSGDTEDDSDTRDDSEDDSTDGAGDTSDDSDTQDENEDDSSTDDSNDDSSTDQDEEDDSNGSGN